MKTESPDNTVLTFDHEKKLLHGKSNSDIAGSFIVSGRWMVNGDTLLLNVDEPTFTDSIIIEGISPSGQTIIKMIDIERMRPIEGVFIFVGDKKYASSENGEIELIAVDTQNLLVRYKNLQGSILTSDVAGRIVIVNVDFRKFNSFNVSQKWLIKNRKLVPLDGGFSTFRKCY